MSKTVNFIWWIAIAILSAVYTAYVVPTIPLDYPASGLLPILAGTAARPYIYRVLAIWIVRGLLAAGIDTVTAMYIIVFVSAVSFIAYMRVLVETFPGYQRYAILIAPCAVVMLCGMMIGAPYNFIYDMPNLLLFTLSLAVMLRGKIAPYLILYTVTCFSKETSALLAVVFAAVYFGKMPWRKYITLGAMQTAIWLAIHGAIMYAFRNSPGDTMDNGLMRHLDVLRAMWMPVLVYDILGVVIVWLVARRWSSKPQALRRAFAVLSPMVFGLYLLGGTPFELRAMAEVIPVTVPLLFATQD